MKPWPGHPLAKYERPWGLGTHLFASFVIGAQIVTLIGMLIMVWQWLT